MSETITNRQPLQSPLLSAEEVVAADGSAVYSGSRRDPAAVGGLVILCRRGPARSEIHQSRLRHLIEFKHDGVRLSLYLDKLFQSDRVLDLVCTHRAPDDNSVLPSGGALQFLAAVDGV
jgi:hypothetical protein